MGQLEKKYIDSYDGREGCLATIAILAAAMASIIMGIIFAVVAIGIINLIKAI